MKTNFLSLFAAFLFASATLALGATNDLSGALQKGLFEEEANHNLEAAAQAYQSVAAQFDKDRKLAATAIFRLGEVYRKQGKTNEANAQYERILKEFPDQTELVKLSRTLGTTGSQKPGLGDMWELSQHLSSAFADYERQKALLADLKKLSREEVIRVLPTVSPDSQFDEISKRLSNAEQQLTVLKGEYTDEHIEVKKAQAVVKLLKQQLNERIDGILTGLEIKVANAKVTVEKLQPLVANAAKGQLNELVSRASRPDGQAKAEVSSEGQEILRIKTMIKDSPDLINAYEGNGRNPLGNAAAMGHLRVAEFLLANGVDVNKKIQDKTALHWAVENGHKEMVELLASHDADLEAKDAAGDTPLHVAARKGFKAITEILLAHKADVDAKESNCQTALHLAVSAGNRSVVETLLESGADVNAKDCYGRTPLFFAAAGNVEMAKLLIANKADVNAKGSSGRTPLFQAIESKKLEMARLLITNKADVNIQSQAGTPLFVAISSGLPDFVELLIQSGADIEAENGAQSYHGYTPLGFAAEEGGTEIAEILLKSGANPNSTNDFGSTPLWIVVGSRNSLSDIRDIADLLIAHKAYVNAKDKNGDTPLIIAVRRLEKPVVELLLKHGANPNIANNQNETPLGYVDSQLRKPAALPLPPAPGARGSTDGLDTLTKIRELLIQHGADENYERRPQIAVTRDFKQVYPIFHKGTNSWNRFSLLETFGATYSSNPLRVGSDASPGFPFPKLSKIKIHRLEGKGEHEISVDLEAILKSGDCSKDIWLEWGDVVEFPEADHRVDEQWTGFPGELLETLPKCLTRNVSVTVKGETKTITFAPTLKKSQHPLGNEREKFADIWFNPLLYFGISRSGLLRTSSDQTRVKVTRINPVTKKSEEQMFNLEKPDSLNHFWLRDGDQIEIPEKP